METQDAHQNNNKFFAEIDVVKQRLNNLKHEFTACELKMKDFEFNKEMVNILMEENHDQLAPFIALFNRQISNVFERYKLSEESCEMLTSNYRDQLANSTLKNVKRIKYIQTKALSLVGHLRAKNKQLVEKIKIMTLKRNHFKMLHRQNSSHLQARVDELNQELNKMRKHKSTKLDPIQSRSAEPQTVSPDVVKTVFRNNNQKSSLRVFKLKFAQQDRPTTSCHSKPLENHQNIKHFDEPYVKTESVVDESTAVIPNQQQACLVSMQVELHEELNQSNYGQDKVQSNLSEQLVVRNDNAVVECGKSKKASLNSKKATESSTAVSRNESLSLIDVSMQVNNCGKDNYENEDETSSCEEEILLDEVNVSKLVDNITKKLANLNMTVPDLAKLLGIGRRALQLRFKDRLPWASLQLPSKLVFLKLNAWYEGKDIDLKTRKFSIGHTKLVKRVNGLLKRKNMSVKKLAEELDIKPLSSLARLLNDPKPWDTLNEAKRIISRKLYTWYIDNDGGKVVEDDSPDREELNVEELVRNVRGILKCTGIQVKELANMIGKSGKSMGGFLTYPSRWDMLTRVTQDQYRELNIWYVKTMADITSGKLAVNTRYFVKHVETLLLRIGVSVEDMIKEVGIERDLFNFPLPWQDLNNAQRKQFLKLNAWCVSQKDDLITAADEKVLDINELNEKVRRLLKRLKLSIKEVAVTLGISTTTLSELLNSKLPWEFLGRVSKDHYLRLNAWFVKSTSNKPL